MFITWFAPENLQVKYKSLDCLRRSNEVNITVPSGLKNPWTVLSNGSADNGRTKFLKICLSCLRLVVGGSGVGGIRLVVYGEFWGKTERLSLSANWGQSLPSDILNSPYLQGTNTSLLGAEWPGDFLCVFPWASLLVAIPWAGIRVGIR